MRPPKPVQDLGDVVVSVEYCARYATMHGWTVQEYLPLVFAHGFAHLAGYTHDQPQAHGAMKEVETAVLRQLGYPRLSTGNKTELPASYLL
jgi:rRNA maturation RNase YbeY